MSRLSSADLKRLLAAVSDLHSHRDFQTLPDRLVHLARQLVPADISTYNEIDNCSGQLRSVHDFSGEAEKLFPAFAAHAHEQPVIRHFRLTGQTQAFRNTDLVSQREYENTAIYNEFYRNFSVPYQIGCFIPRTSSFEVCLALQRGKRNFTHRDRDILSLFSPHFASAWHNARAWSLLGQTTFSFEKSQFSQSHHERIRLGRNWRIEEISDAARTSLERLFGVAFVAGQKLPALFEDWLKRSASASPEAILSSAVNQPLTARLGGETGVVSWYPESPLCSWLILNIKRPGNSIQAGDSRGLTARESEVLQWVLAGKTNPEIGVILNVSPNTVRKHLERVYAKLGVENRVAAMRALFDCEL